MSKQPLRGSKPKTSDIVKFAKDYRQAYYDRCIKSTKENKKMLEKKIKKYKNNEGEEGYWKGRIDSLNATLFMLEEKLTK